MNDARVMWCGAILYHVERIMREQGKDRMEATSLAIDHVLAARWLERQPATAAEETEAKGVT